MRDFYSLLNCDKSASGEHLKKAYFQQLRKFHPDKNNSVKLDPFFDLIRAWKVLGDTGARATYDFWLCEQQLRADKQLLFDEIWLNCGCAEGTAATTSTGTATTDHSSSAVRCVDFVQHCRCGGIYEVPAEAVEQLALDYLLVDCSNCSLTLRVWRSSACDEHQTKN